MVFQAVFKRFFNLLYWHPELLPLTLFCARAYVRPRLDGALEGLVALLSADDGHFQLFQVVGRPGELGGNSIYLKNHPENLPKRIREKDSRKKGHMYPRWDGKCWRGCGII